MICLQIERRELSARKRYSSRFVVRRNFLGGQKKLTHSPGLDLGDKSSYCHKESVNLPSNSLLEDAAINVAKKLETVDACDQVHPTSLMLKISQVQSSIYYLVSAAYSVKVFFFF